METSDIGPRSGKIADALAPRFVEWRRAAEELRLAAVTAGQPAASAIEENNPVALVEKWLREFSDLIDDGLWAEVIASRADEPSSVWEEVMRDE